MLNFNEKIFVSPNLRIASIPKRVSATLIDYILFWMVVVGSAALSGFVAVAMAVPAQHAGIISGSILFLLIMIYIGIYLFLMDKRGLSPGKALLKLRIVTPTGGRPSSDRLFFFRYLLPRFFYAFGITYFLDVFFLFSPQHRTLHDLWSGTIVIDQSKQQKAAA